MSVKIKLLDTAARDFSAQVARLYKLAGWLSSETPDLSAIKKALANSHCCFGAFDGKKMVGFFRALSDGVGDAYLLELFVEEPYRNAGVGDALCKAIIAHLKSEGIGWITCISTPEAKSLYAKHGAIMQKHAPFRF